MVRLLRPFGRAVTYTRWLHLFIAVVWPAMWMFVEEAWWTWLVAAVTLAPAALVPAMRTVEGLQARLLLTGHRHNSESSDIVVAPSVSWRDRGRLVLWLEARLLLGWATAMLSVKLLLSSVDLVASAFGQDVDEGVLILLGGHRWWHVLLAPVSLAALAATVVGSGLLITALALRLLGPSPAERLAALEERTEQLLERTRIARELHDSIGHALTVAVVQAGAARAAGDPAFTDRALDAIEETGRAALEDLERVLGILRESERPVSSRPTLTDADRLLESARASGAKVDAELTGPVDTVPGPVSREGYRILQEALTNVLRHAGAVPVRVRIDVTGEALALEVRNPLTADIPGPGRGSGLRGIRERAALLGGHAHTGPDRGDWQVHAELPLR
ncbi:MULTISPECIES: histidine kinase [Streptomyces]|uniref:histidine kinase n=1 Tax=Streptomyces sviceus (strain ATCC 29083 / DSM 924 / JCM 4929 / NBRC 13980 / NCIMB 11184 / NRRL 5439 / UC 5370) TaxID=463191 RepID=B5HZH9_STRX2|nr:MULTISPECIES: histidine kinase [Streptomyces]EDY58234.1 two-component system sensor kinase [Streptomyces sviceus ATCC 29083]MYT04329.1 two-component sensor histidine kinase [Streptomyces sp. SID5470]